MHKAVAKQRVHGAKAQGHLGAEGKGQKGG